MSENSSAKNFSFVGIGRIIATVLQALFYLLFASLLEPESYGQLNVILAIAGTFATASRLGLNYSLQVYQAKQKSALADQVKTLFIISTAAVSIILLPIDLFAAILCVGISFFAMNQQNLLGLQKYKTFMINSILKSGLFFIIPIVLYFLLDIPGIVLGMAIASLIGSIPFFKELRLRSISELKLHYKFLFQNYVTDLGSLSLFVDKLLISYLFGNFLVGIYQFNLQVLVALSALPGVLSSYLISEESVGASHRKITLLVLIASVVLAVVVILTAPFFINQFFPKYSDGIIALQIIVISIIPQTIWAIYYSKLLSLESTLVGFISIVNVGILLFLIAILGNIFELVGLSLAILFSSIITAVLGYFLYRRTKISFEKKTSQ